jgi:hypothetical protein
MATLLIYSQRPHEQLLLLELQGRHKPEALAFLDALIKDGRTWQQMQLRRRSHQYREWTRVEDVQLCARVICCDAEEDFIQIMNAPLDRTSILQRALAGTVHRGDIDTLSPNFNTGARQRGTKLLLTETATDVDRYDDVASFASFGLTRSSLGARDRQERLTARRRR